jgi:hypothetical protein
MESLAWDRDPQILAHVPDDAMAVMLYGSCARGDTTADSDTDLLLLVPDRPGSSVIGALSIVRYLPSQIEEMVAERSLFSWHLRTEGIYLRDRGRRLKTILGAHAGPNPTRSLAAVHELTAVLDVSEEQFEAAPGITRVVRYLLRTAVYAHAINVGHQSFAVGSAADAVDPSGCMRSLLERREGSAQRDWAAFVNMRTALHGLLGGLRSNEFGSLEALVVRASASQRSLSALALHALSEPSGELAYAATGMPLL